MLSIIGSADPKYLAATDILIGDMSNTNYEFLLYDRPVILLANEWLAANFPDIGAKTDLDGLGKAIEESVSSPSAFASARRLWLQRTISLTDESASKRMLDIILQEAGEEHPEIALIYGGNPVRKTNVVPLAEEAARRGLRHTLVSKRRDLNASGSAAPVLVGTHFRDLWPDCPGYKVHIDHDLKGISTANIEYAFRDYTNGRHFPHIDLHITAGEAGDRRTSALLGPFSDRTRIGGYPKADHFLALNTPENKKAVYEELGLTDDLPLVTYAPAGERSFMKPGGSLKPQVIDRLRSLAALGKYHVLVKQKYAPDISFRLKQQLRKVYMLARRVNDDGSRWRSLFPEDSRGGSESL
jgi:hypothetical protein